MCGMNDRRRVVADGLRTYPIPPGDSSHRNIEQIRCHRADRDLHGPGHDSTRIDAGRRSDVRHGQLRSHWVQVEIGCSRFHIVSVKAHSLSQAASAAAWDTRFPGETQKPQRPSGPPASMGPTSFDRRISEARNRSSSSASLTAVMASLLSMLSDIRPSNQ